jgi:peptidoglycan/LPS O-acetylase OafA/YrhL
MFGMALLGRLLFWRLGIDGPDWDLLYKLTPFRLEAIALGSLVAVMRHEGQPVTKLKRTAALASLSAGLAFVVLYYFTRNVAPRSLPMKTLGYTLIDLFYAGLLALAWVAAEQRTGISKFLRFPALTSIGKYSYGMYMWHVVILGALPWWMVMKGGSPLVRSIIQVICGAALTYGVALISWHVFEKRFLVLKDRLQASR